MKSNRWHTCNVFESAPDKRRLWRFTSGKDKVSAAGSQSFPVSQPPPAKLVHRDWKELIQPKLNLACLLSDQVYLRVLQLPAGDPAELPGMVEFQLEKIAPLQPANLAWTFEIVPSAPSVGLGQTVVVVMAARAAVEAFLGQMEGMGYVVDRLEIPLFRELRGMGVGRDGIQLIAEQHLDKTMVLAAWWMKGILKEISLLRIPRDATAGDQLVQQLNHTAWAGEMNGWLVSAPSIRLNADLQIGDQLQSALSEWASQTVVLAPRLAPDQVAELMANQALQPQTEIALVPSDVVARNRQRFMDGLWWKGLSTLGTAYIASVFVYMAVLTYRKNQLETVETQAIPLSKQYTNTLQLKEQVQLLEEQVNLKYAGLEAWRSVVDTLPEQLTLVSLDFVDGKTLRLNGTVNSDATEQVTKFNSELLRVTNRSQALFSSVKPAQITSRPGSVGSSWSFEAELKRSSATP